MRLIARQPLRLLAELVPELQRLGLSLGAMDLLIAAHALALDRPLVSLDQAFAHVPGWCAHSWIELWQPRLHSVALRMTCTND